MSNSPGHRTNIDDEEFANLFEQMGAKKLSEHLSIDVRSVYKKRRRLEKRLNTTLKPPIHEYNTSLPPVVGREDYKLRNGHVVIGSDAHYWPGYVSTAHRAFLHVIDKLKPECIVLNGDILDGSTISRHAPIGWETKPTLIQEIQTCQERLAEIEATAPANAKLYWTLGNHDARFETRLAGQAPEFAEINGSHLKDHFPYWRHCWSLWINDDIVIKHRYKGGVHATHNNTVTAGKTMVTGHLHSAKVTPYTDYNGTRWGVDCGTMADAYGLQFATYMEDNPRNWRSAFCLLTIENGELHPPEIVYILGENKAAFRGEFFKL